MTDPTAQTEGRTKLALQVRAAAQLSEQNWPDGMIMSVVQYCMPVISEKQRNNIKPPNAADWAVFMRAAASLDLNPLLGEIWLAPMKGRLRVLTGRDALLKKAATYPGYRGVISGIVHEKDKFVSIRDDEKIKILHEIVGMVRGARLGGYAIARFDNQADAYAQRLMADFKNQVSIKEVWQQFPDDMLETRVIVAALRKRINLSGVYTKEEFIDSDDDIPQDGTAAEIAEATQSRAEQIAQDIRNAKARMSSPEAEIPVDISDYVVEVDENAPPTIAQEPPAAAKDDPTAVPSMKPIPEPTEEEIRRDELQMIQEEERNAGKRRSR